MDEDVDDELLELETNALLKEGENILDDNVDDVEIPEPEEKSSESTQSSPSKSSPLSKQVRQCLILIRKNIWIFVSKFT